MLGRSLLMKASGAAVTGDPFFSSVSLLLHGDGANNSTTIIDSSPRPKIITRFGDTKISTDQSKFGGSSIFFDASGDYLLLDGSTDFAFGTGGWTIEFFYYTNRTNSFFETIFDTRVSGQNVANGIVIFHAGGLSQLTCDTGGTGVAVTGLTLNQWYHVAFSKFGNNLRAFLNGVQSGATMTHTASIIANPNRPVIGANLSLNANLNAYLDEFRITAAGRYTGNFTPPTAPFPDF